MSGLGVCPACGKHNALTYRKIEREDHNFWLITCRYCGFAVGLPMRKVAEKPDLYAMITDMYYDGSIFCPGEEQEGIIIDYKVLENGNKKYHYKVTCPNTGRKFEFNVDKVLTPKEVKDVLTQMI